MFRVYCDRLRTGSVQCNYLLAICEIRLDNESVIACFVLFNPWVYNELAAGHVEWSALSLVCFLRFTHTECEAGHSCF